jgi:predicted CopG family antitoxin
MPKTITIKKSVYDELIGVKKKNESFSELLERLLKSQSKNELLLQLRGSVEFEGKDELLKEVERKRWGSGN